MSRTDVSAQRPASYAAGLALAALGVVYGDIGTSPLYSLRETFHHAHGVAMTPENIMGAISLIFWSLVLVISLKYVTFVLRADNRGEGGILALMALVTLTSSEASARRRYIVLLGLFGTALLYGDGIITPAISVLSAVEGLEIATPRLASVVVPVTIAILIGLFSIQKFGTAKVGQVFGPVMLLWFITLAALGLWQLVQQPEILWSIWPGHAVSFFWHNGWYGFLALGSVFLVVTGGEALYSDLGHFGVRPIRMAWFYIVFPALLLNYLGQGALLLGRPEAIKNPFYFMAPRELLYPLVAISTLATVVASQALITGIFSLARMASHLGYSPRVAIQHTSSHEIGQVYVGRVNWLLLVSCCVLVLGFQSSTNLAAAYGLAVTTTMVITTILFYFVVRHIWAWTQTQAVAMCGFFLLFDLAFWGANLVKIPHGGWLPLVIGLVGFIIMSTWKDGRSLLAVRLREKVMPVDAFVSLIRIAQPLRLPGVAVFLSSSPTGTPPALVHTLEHFRALHEQLVLLSVQTQEVPHVPVAERLTMSELGEGLYSVALRFGFMDDPDVPAALAGLPIFALGLDSEKVTYILGRENLIPTRRKGIALWRERLFTMISQNARSAADYFSLPADQVVEVGIRIEL
jgi:KUP system potassium uptake protein